MIERYSCPRCGRQVDKNAVRCSGCGARFGFGYVLKCRRCGQFVNTGMLQNGICPRCLEKASTKSKAQGSKFGNVVLILFALLVYITAFFTWLFKDSPLLARILLTSAAGLLLLWGLRSGLQPGKTARLVFSIIAILAATIAAWALHAFNPFARLALTLSSAILALWGLLTAIRRRILGVLTGLFACTLALFWLLVFIVGLLKLLKLAFAAKILAILPWGLGSWSPWIFLGVAVVTFVLGSYTAYIFEEQIERLTAPKT